MPQYFISSEENDKQEVQKFNKDETFNLSILRMMKYYLIPKWLNYKTMKK